MSGSDALRALIARHCETLRSELRGLRAVSQRLGDCPDDAGAAIADGLERAHKLKGSSGSLGYPEISVAAAEFENCLKMLEVATGNAAAMAVRETLSQFVVLEQLIVSVSPERSTLYNVILPEAAAG
jgi:HPt (histidine-containing phosphotransfer) domain-containing protein